MRESSLQAALDLARTGLAVFPCRCIGEKKIPTTPHGFHDASSDPTMVHELWRRWPGPLVGVRTGAASGIDVLDLDAKHAEARDWWREHRDRLPSTRTHRTRSGGLHLIFRYAAGLRCSTSKLARGVDTKTDGGCCTWWPAAGLPVLRDAKPAPWPDWLFAQLAPHRASAPPRLVVPDDRQLRGILARVARAQQGERNALTFWGACRLSEMVATGLIGEGDAIALIAEAATCTGLSRAEAIATARSGLRTVGQS